MPTYANQVVAGEGLFRTRLVIAGWPVIFADAPSLERTLPDGRVIVSGLVGESIRISASADLARAALEEQEMQIEVVDDDAATVTAALSTPPSLRTYLTASITHLSTTIDVADTSAWPSSGVLHIHTEAIAYAGKTGTSFTDCTRGYWDTPARYHYTGDGERMRSPLVTDRPRSIHGRDVSLSVFGSADSSTGAGTERWRGVCSTDRSYQDGVWSWSVEPVSSKLRQQLGGDLEEPCPIRGIKLPAGGGLLLRLTLSTGDTARVFLSGFWETQTEFCAALRTAIDSATSGWTWDADAALSVEPLGTVGWRLVYVTGGTTAHTLAVSPVPIAESSELGVSPVDLLADPTWIDASSLVSLSGTPSTGRTYYMDVRAPVPRAVVGDGRVVFSGFEDRSRTSDPNTNSLIYLGGTVAPNASMMLGIDLGGDYADTGGVADAEETWTLPASAASTSARTITVSASVFQSFRLGPSSRLRLMRVLGGGITVGDLIERMALTLSRELTNAHGSPALSSADFDFDWYDVDEAIGGMSLGYRWWLASEGVALDELLRHELMLIGCYLSVRSDGRLAVRRLRAPLLTDPSAVSVSGANTLRAPSITYNAQGVLTEVDFFQGWDEFEHEHVGLTIRARNLETADPTQMGGVLEIAPRSHRGLRRGENSLEIDPQDAYSIASHVLGMYGGAYAQITAEVTMGAGDGTGSLFAAEIGDTVEVSSAFLPDLIGGRGLSLTCVLTGHDWSPYEGKGTVQLHASLLRTAGYAPGFPVASQSGATTSWTITLTTSGYLASGEAVSTWYSVGDRIWVRERDTASPTTIDGTIDAISGSDVDVTLDASWTPGASEWQVSYQWSDTVSEAPATGRAWAQTDFAFVADSVRRLDLATSTIDARDFAP